MTSPPNKHTPFRLTRSATKRNHPHPALGLAVLVSLSLPALAQTAGLSLNAVLEGLPQSPEWQIADLTYAQSERQLESARASSNLSVNAGGSYNYTRPSNDSTAPNGTVTPAADLVTSNAGVNANASINVLPWSQPQVQARSAEYALGRAALDRNDTRRSIVVNTTNQYFTARTAALDLELARGNETLADARLKVANQQQANGQITREQQLSSQQALETAKINTLAARNTLELARLSLFNTLGMTPNDAALSTAPTELPLPKAGLDALIKEALEKRGDMQKASSRLREAEDTLGAANLNRWLPNSTISLGYGQLGGQGGPSVTGSLNIQSGVASLNAAAPVYQNPEQKSNPGLTFSVNLSIPILAPSQDASIRSAQTNLDTAQKGLETARRSAELDVRQKFNDANIAAQRLGLARIGLQSARSNLDVAKARQAAGTNTAIDLQSAEQSARQAERDLDNATAAQQVSVLRLRVALGKDPNAND